MQKAVEVTELASSLSLKSLVLCLNPLLSSKQKKNIPYLLPIKSQW